MYVMVVVGLLNKFSVKLNRVTDSKNVNNLADKTKTTKLNGRGISERRKLILKLHREIT